MPLIDPVVVDDKVTTLVVPTDTPAAPGASTQASDDGLPEKFKGKSPKEIAEAYQNLESELGRARNEIGTNRRLVDELLNLRRDTTAKSEPERQPVTPHELAENPEETITTVARRVADERTAGAEQRLEKLEQELAAQEFEKRHPGYRDLARSAEFGEWLKGSPLRVKLVQKAAQNDWDAGDELMSLYKEHQAAKPAPSAGKDPKEAAREAGLAKSGGSGANKVVQGGDGKKIYSRAELADLYIRNPEEYSRRFDSEFRQAYAEKRVR